ncbi:aminoglycoside phosphotransferase family protein [Sporosarcina sp. ACRSL]|uniref:aminoglycoside phosphotransferase family protein n=1 Tax=Sporosarcina sp. ACRSL TaxID=2918215 RepID=UPI001EF636B0|nr:aminoglycoside phosphotransferase family protein [Sporosarcina sp. ACRSL]MCG7342598.1 aminoglycoside phosphotransferase family protein [Sporosarcina sp. ACRSL]
MKKMDIPISFEEKIINCFGEPGKEWLQSLDEKVHSIADNWGLKVEGPVSNLSYNYVLNVIDGNNIPYILKIGLPGFDFENEIRTLQLYDGKGCARLVIADAEQGALLLEKLQPGTMLSTEPDERVVIENFCHVWKQIRRPLPKDGDFPTVLHWAKAFSRYHSNYPENDGPIPNEWVKMAVDYLHEIQQTSLESELLHGDLHHENILYSAEQGWLAIDPKGVGGSPYFDVVSFMINHLFTKPDPKALLKLRVDLISETLQLEREQLLKAAVSMTTLYACWSVEDKDPDWDKTFQCAKWFHEFL